MAGNFGAMAMENMGKVAGMASSLQGSLANIVASVFGTAIGRAFDGTTVPLYAGYFFCGLIALVIVFVTERGKFFVAHHAPRAKAGD
jgi:DHA1 family bicyclomycin/chloramphenicol resistance-like MFS transporter